VEAATAPARGGGGTTGSLVGTGHGESGCRSGGLGTGWKEFKEDKDVRKIRK
jgi:hypothetical protein